jgi:hypothetical protein
MRRPLAFSLTLALSFSLSCRDREPENANANANANGSANVNANANESAKAKAPDAGNPARALAAALAAAQEARGATPCERAFDAFIRMKAAAEKLAVSAGAPAIAEKDRFLAVCSSLPPTVQACLDVREAIAHPKECQDAQARLDPAAQARLKTLFSKPQ